MTKNEPLRARRLRVALFQGSLFLAAVAFAVLTFWVKTSSSLSVDLQITGAIQSIKSPAFALVMTMTSWPGFNPQSTIIAGLIIVLIFTFGLRWEAVMALLAALFSAATNLLVKDLIQRPRPTSSSVNVIDLLTSYSFPSGHVMFYLGFFGFLAFLVFSMSKPSIKRTLLLGFLSLLITLIGISRVYLGQHWASDVLGAYLLGSLTLASIIRIYLWGKTRFL